MSEAEIWMYRGDDEELQFEFEDGDGNPISISGCGIKMTVREDWDSEEVVMAGSAPAGSHVDAAGGITKISFPSSVTALLEPKGYVYDVQVTDAQGLITTILADDLFIKEDATR